jgi:hypothetical protein
MRSGNMKRVCFLATVLLLISNIVLATSMQNVATASKEQDITGKELLSKITSSKPTDHMYALGYVSGVYGVLESQGIVPDRATAERLLETVKKYLEKNKNILDHPASELVTSALKLHSTGR